MTVLVGLVLLVGLWAFAGRLPGGASEPPDRILRAAVGRRSTAGAVDPPAGPVLTVVAGGRSGRQGPAAWRESWRARRQDRRRDLEVVEQLPDVVDLLSLTSQAGLPVPSALAVVGDRPGGPMGEAFSGAAVRLRRGAALGDVLPWIGKACGDPARSLVDALADHDRYGTPLGPTLDRLGVEARQKRRRQGEEAARRLPVLLLFPLVLTTLPAFILLAIVPLVAGALGSVGL